MKFVSACAFPKYGIIIIIINLKLCSKDYYWIEIACKKKTDFGIK